MIQPHATSQAPAAIGPYAQAVSVSGFLYTSGQIALDPGTGEIVAGGFEPQARQVLANLRAVLASAGCTFADVVKATVYVVDLADFPRLKITFWAPTLPEKGAKDPGEPVLGVWKAVSIKRNSPKGLEMGDCELVEIFRDRVMPKFLTRDMQGDINCIPHQLVGNRIDLRFEVLTGMKSVDDAAARGD